MKIIVLGTTIDTENIYAVTEIKRQFGMSSQFSNNEEIWFEFSIISFNKNVMPVVLLTDFKEEATYELTCKAEKIFIKEDKHLPFLKKITTLRDALIAYWSNNQTNIPKLEF